MSVPKKIIAGLAVIALLGTVTNYVYFSPLLTLLLPLCIFVFNKKTLPRPIFWLYVYFFLFLMSAILYDWQSVIEFGFYRRDGNFIISYSPLFLLPLFSLRFNAERYIRYFYLFALSLYAILFGYHLLTMGSNPNIHELVFGGLFIAQNAVGGFLSILAGLGFAYSYHKGSKKEWFFFLIIFVILAATYSRGSILGLILGIMAWYFATTRRFKLLVAMIAVPVLFTIGTILIGYPSYKNVIGNQTEVETQIDSDISGKNANILLRVFYTFPRAYYIFTHSPVLGAGVGSYDDRPLQLEKILPLVSYNAQSKKMHTDAHAHHSYLHILAEQGVIGLVVFLIFWIFLFKYLMRMRGHPVMRDFLLISYFTITIASFTEHRITTPSMMLPFTICLGLIIAQKEQVKTYIFKK